MSSTIEMSSLSRSMAEQFSIPQNRYAVETGDMPSSITETLLTSPRASYHGTAVGSWYRAYSNPV